MILGAFYRITTPILSLASGLLGYSMALISDREAATTYVFSAALVSIIMLFSHVFISKYKQGIHDLEDKDINGISIFYAKKILIVTFIISILAFFLEHKLLSVMLYSVPVSCGYLLVSFKAQVYQNDRFWKAQFIGALFRAIILWLLHVFWALNFLTLSILSVLVQCVMYIQYNGINFESKNQKCIDLDFRGFLDGLARALRADHEYHILVLIGIVQTKILPESSYTITLPYLNSGRIALRSFLNKWDMRRLSNYFSIVLLSISILLYFLVAKFDEYVLQTSFYLFKTDLSETIVFGLVIFAFSVWTSGSLLLELLPVVRIYSFYCASFSLLILLSILGSFSAIGIEGIMILYYFFIGIILNRIHGKNRIENI